MAWFDLFKRKSEPPAQAPVPAPVAAAAAGPVDTARQAQQRWETELTARAAVWVETLPQACRPAHLCATLPRLANRLAVAWSDPARTAGVLDELLVDRRGGRQGFPPPVSAELRALQVLNDARQPAPAPPSQ